MNNAMNILNKYDIEVLRSWKGRGAILCETKTGIKILKEYKGSPKRLCTQQKLLQKIKENGYLQVEEVIPNKEGEYITKEDDMTAYYLKEYKEGTECNNKEFRDCSKTIENMAALHKAMELPQLAEEERISPYSLPLELEKHNREIRRVKKYLKEKSKKNDFEMFLHLNYDFFYRKAECIMEEIEPKKEMFTVKGGTFCHGDLQHHNVLLKEQQVFFINFEKYVLDNPTRDLCLFFRKMMEKNNWSVELGKEILQKYERQRALSLEDRYQLFYRLSYPEKFWKIVNYYYNSSKQMIPGKNLEKLVKIMEQEEKKSIFMEQNFLPWVLRKG